MAAAHAILPGTALRFQHETNIALDREVREKARLLNHVTHVTAQLDEVKGASALAVKQNLAARRQNHSIDRAEQRGFSRTAPTKDGGCSSFFDRERDRVEQQPALRSRKAKIAEFDGSAHGSLAVSSSV